MDIDGEIERSYNRTIVNNETERMSHKCERALHKGQEFEHVLMSINTKHAKNDNYWYLDTGCSNLMTRKKEWLIDLDSSVKSIVGFVDNSVIMAEGAGRIMIRSKNRQPAYMNNVLYVPNMKRNMLSLGQLLGKGYTMNIHQKHIEIFDDRKCLVLKAPLAKNRTFKVKLSATIIQCLSSINTEEEEWLWHYRYGHLNFRSLRQLKDKDMVIGVPEIHAPKKVCEGCVIGKQTRKQFKRTSHKRAKAIS
ncbi:uncharacterized protein LOC124822778 [Vigna umbellata]|uniref:uncharacterized protein LOC124822778 n=1 Tax=Vigna umbellata TaxID=87088 RepID=UPI001F5FC13E|nr:uncharacterized protein LOC124822778 [Vigna umbellata]